MKILRVNMLNKKIEIQEVPPKYQEFGGRALIAKILLDEVDPLCHPLGRSNKLIIASGLLNSSGIPMTGRISVGAKSPLTWGVKESNSGGKTGTLIAKQGYHAIIIEDKPAEDDQNIYLLELVDRTPKLIIANDLKGMGNYETVRTLEKNYGNKVACFTIGQAGEMMLQSACINNTDIEFTPSRVNGRGGMGAVMGSKRIKAMVVGNSNNPSLYKNDEAFREARKSFVQGILQAPSTKFYNDFGTPGFLDPVNELSCLPTKNFTTGSYEKAENINGDTFIQKIIERGGDPKGHACMPGCIIKCSHAYHDQDGKVMVSPLEYETISLLGSNCAVDNLEMISDLNYVCNDIGVDTIEIGGALGVAMGAGVIPYGDGNAMKELLLSIKRNDPLGRIIASGVVATAKIYGATHVPAVKGQGMPGYEPRGLKGLGVTYATSPQGADHTAGHTMSAKLDHHKPEGQAAASKKSQRLTTIFDVMGFCSFVGPALRDTPEIIMDVVNKYYGWNLTLEEFLDIGTKTLKMEIEFNHKAGFTQLDDRLPESFLTDKNIAADTTFDVSDEDLDSVTDW